MSASPEDQAVSTYVPPESALPDELAGLMLEIEQACQVTIPDAAEELDGLPMELALLLSRLRHLKTMVTDAYQAVEDRLVDSMPEPEMFVPGIGQIEYHASASRTAWQHDALIPKVVTIIADDVKVWHDFDTGETFDPMTHIEDRQAIVSRVVSKLRDFLSPSWKVGTKQRDGTYVGGLRGDGIDPDEYCATAWSRKQIKWPK